MLRYAHARFASRLHGRLSTKPPLGVRRFTATAGTFQASPQPAQVLQKIIKHRFFLLANAACAIQMLQWYQTDVLYIRGLNVIAMLMFIAYDAHKKVWVYVGWEVLYTLLNSYQITKILRERRDIELTDVEQTLWDAAFSDFMTKCQMRELLSLAEKKELNPNEVVALKGDPQAERVLILVRGAMAIIGYKKVELGRSYAGEFVGEFHFIESMLGSREEDRREAVTLRACEEGATVLEWQDEVLSKHLGERKDVRHALEAIWMRHIVDKFAQRNESAAYRAYLNVLRGVLASGTVEDAEIRKLHRFREKQDISEEQHLDALDELGYTETDFEKLITRDQRMHSRFLRWLQKDVL
eukprot:TRINITY_DN72106_c0_g1_i1.p1 TRINITY_DN72106_c0_g1~~TRINITY_DN72106_c0_g1_i1.p1  ORF type:complete len:354 (+),score=80.24 TRINITY_DN72106_c0_g1_i1:28-1089(+)